MKKRFIATLLVGAVAVSSAVGLSACGTKSVSLPKGVSVSEEEWKEAFSSEKLNDLDNYTLENSKSKTVSAKGTVTDEIYTIEMDYSLKSSYYSTYLFDKINGYAYSETTDSETTKTTATHTTLNVTEKYKSKDTSTSKSYYEPGTDEDEYWRASYSKSNATENSSESGKSSEKDENYWTASKTSYFASNRYSSVSNDFSSRYYDDKDIEDAESNYITYLYDKFTYSDGVYTATLYRKYSVTGFSVPVACTISVSIDGTGHIIGISERINESDTYNDAEEGINCNYTVKYENVYAVSNIGNTNPSQKADKKIKNAIQKAKDEYALYND